MRTIDSHDVEGGHTANPMMAWKCVCVRFEDLCYISSG